jgi:hypothetical protein
MTFRKTVLNLFLDSKSNFILTFAIAKGFKIYLIDFVTALIFINVSFLLCLVPNITLVGLALLYSGGSMLKPKS